MSFARTTKTARPLAPESCATEARTRRSSVPPPRTISRTTAWPSFQAPINAAGSPGPGRSAEGETVPVGAGATVEGAVVLGRGVEVAGAAGAATPGAVVPAAELV